MVTANESRRPMFVIAVCWCVCLIPVDVWAQAGMTFDVRNNPNAVFAGTKMVQEITFNQQPEPGNRLVWKLQVGERVLRSGEAPAIGPQAKRSCRVEVQLPPVRSGVVLDVDFSVSVTTRGGTVTQELRQPLFLFPADISTDVEVWNATNLGVFDPQQTTADNMTSEGFAFQSIESLAALRKTKVKVIVIGEATSFDKWRDLPTDLVALAERGVSVVCLSPRGQVELSAVSDSRFLVANRFQIMDRVLRDTDKRFILHYRLAEPSPNAMSLVAANRAVAVRFQQESGWHWWESEFANNARIVFCSVPINKQWKTSPVPRHLLARILNNLGTPKELQEEK